MAFITPAKHRTTLADHVVTGIAPALIIVLVASLVFFLALLLYRTGYPMHLYWTLGWFVLGSVLITRISIESGADRAVLFGFALGGVTALWLIRYVDPPFAGIGLLGVIWWCTSKMVRDCTLIDEDEDATGEGLLDSAGLREEAPAAGGAAPKRKPGRLVYWNYATKALREKAIAEMKAGTQGPPERKPSQGPPGAWIIYFSLGALPLFGIGDALLPQGDPFRRGLAFALVDLYMLAAFGLLLTTSFLGFRRYLRQRRLRMPLNITAGWIFSGAGLAVMIVLLSILLPRPQAAYSLPSLAEKIGNHSMGKPFWKLTQESDSKDLPEGEQGRGKDGGNHGSPSAEDKQSSNSSPSQKEEDQSGGSGGSKSGSRTAKKNDLGPQLNEVMAPRSNPVLVKNLINLAFALAALWLLVRHGRNLWAGLVALWRDFLSLLGPKKNQVQRRVIAPPPVEGKKFTGFKNPFAGTGTSRLSRADLVRYTFEALEAWAAGQGLARKDNETPLEFATRLQESLPDVASETHDLACQYTRVAYAGREPDQDSMGSLAAMWGYMAGHPSMLGQ